MPERLERVRRHVGTRLVRDLAEVAEGDLVEPHRLGVDVERAPPPPPPPPACMPTSQPSPRVTASSPMSSCRSASEITAASSMSGYRSFSYSNAQPPGARSGTRIAQSPLTFTSCERCDSA